MSQAGERRTVHCKDDASLDGSQQLFLRKTDNVVRTIENICTIMRDPVKTRVYTWKGHGYNVSDGWLPIF